MSDPLHDFRWDELYERYKHATRSYNADSPYLTSIGAPQSDAMAYVALVDLIEACRLSRASIGFEQYLALVYWKHYSNRFRNGYFKPLLKEVDNNTKKLNSIFLMLPTGLERDVGTIIEIGERIQRIRLTPLGGWPTCSTLLHLGFPNTVPIVDAMVLRAAGIRDRHNNSPVTTNEAREYMPIAWELANKHTHHRAARPPFQRETSLRLVDMALWITRDSLGSPVSCA